jgi:hypothetical protein
MLKNVHNGLITQIWSDENSHAVHQVLLHDIKVGIWCTVSGMQMFGPVFYWETMNSDHYVKNTLESFFEQLTYVQR